MAKAVDDPTPLVAEAGVKVTEMVQFAPAASDAPQVLLCAKSAGFAPASVIPLIVSAALPLFFNVAVCAAEATPVFEENVNELGVNEAIGAGGTVPVSLKLAVCGDPAALSATVCVAVKLTAEAGVKTTEIAQVAPAASDAPHVLVWPKSAGFAPAIEIERMASAAFPVLLNVAVCAALLAPVFAVKVSEAGERDATGAAGAVPVPLSDAVCGEFDALSVTVSVPGSEPRDVGVNVTAFVQVDPAASVVPQVLLAE